jgi:hypothetical protein
MEVAMKTAGSILGILLVAALGACAHESGPGANSPDTAGASAGQYESRGQAGAPSCPLAQLETVDAAVTDIRDGVAIAFSSSPEEAASLRQNVRALADANDKRGNAFIACPCGVSRRALGAAESMASDHPSDPSEMFGGPAETGGRPIGEAPSADAKVEDSATGAVLELKAKDNSQVDSLRAFARAHVRAMKRTCMTGGIHVPGETSNVPGQNHVVPADNHGGQ